MNPHIIIAGGGTGGHLFPGLAVAEELRSRGAQVSFVGTERGIEARIIPQHQYPLYFLDIVGLKRQGFVGTFKSLWKLPKALLEARRLLRKLKPSAVLGVGGYASGPMVFQAARSRIPTAILEQNSIPGLTNRVLSRFVDQIFTSFPQTTSAFPPKKIHLVGNPVRASLDPSLRIPKEPHQSLRLLVLGGSQGARAINELVPKAIALLQEQDPSLALSVVHQTGSTDEERVRLAYQEVARTNPQEDPSLSIQATAFIQDMAKAYAHCDLVLSRAGATTLSEITAMGLPSLLIPFPAAADDHQTHNARFLEAAGAAMLLAQAQTTPERLAQILAHLCKNPNELSAMAQKSKTLGRPHATQVIADWLLHS